MTFTPLTRTEFGSVHVSDSRCCLRVRFGDLMWLLSRENFAVFRDYIHFLSTPEGFEMNLYEPGKVVVVMEEHIMMALMNPQELYHLSFLLEKAGLELLRRNLMAQFGTDTAHTQEELGSI